MRRANDQVARWMREAGMRVREDSIGNLIGRYPSANPKAKTFILGSHLDTVRDAGKFDGVLGVLVAIACVGKLHRERKKLPFHIEVIGFADEEGVRFQSAYLGSGAMTGTTSRADLQRTDASGVTFASAIEKFGGNPMRLDSARRDRSELLGYAEIHIEQGPVLESRRCALGVVTGIVGISRAQVTFRGKAGHAGTTPMRLRRDALAAAAEFMQATERIASGTRGLVATVGEVEVVPGAVNVIPGLVTLSLDVRHADDPHRQAAFDRLRRGAHLIAERRKVRVKWQPRADSPATRCSPQLMALMKCAAKKLQRNVPRMVSGAGHDAAEMAKLTPVTMLFVRCKGGISHHPAESVKANDTAMAIQTMTGFLEQLSHKG